MGSGGGLLTVCQEEGGSAGFGQSGPALPGSAPGRAPVAGPPGERPCAASGPGRPASADALSWPHAFRPAAPYLAAPTVPVVGAAAPRERGAFCLGEAGQAGAES